MKFAAHSLLSLALIVVAVPFLNGQQSAVSQTTTAPAVSNPDAPNACPHLFTSGNSASNTYIQYCVTDHGSITSIETPFGHFHLGAQGDGYGFCQESPTVEYHDYLAGDTGNWNPPQVLSLSASAIKVSHATADGNWTLVQTISKVAATGSIKIVMALTNNQPMDKVAYLVRYADVDADGHKLFPYAAGGSLQGAFAWATDQGGFHYGLNLANIGKWSGYQQGFVQQAPNGPNTCAFAYNAASFGIVWEDGYNQGDTSLVYAYVDVVPAHGTKTVTMSYHAM